MSHVDTWCREFICSEIKSFISIFLPIIHPLNNPPHVSPLHQIKINMSFSKRPIMMEISCEIGNKLMTDLQRRRYICGLFRRSSVSQRHGVMSQQPNSNCNEHQGFRLTPSPSTFLLVFLRSSSSVSFITTEIKCETLEKANILCAGNCGAF